MLKAKKDKNRGEKSQTKTKQILHQTGMNGKKNILCEKFSSLGRDRGYNGVLWSRFILFNKCTIPLSP